MRSLYSIWAHRHPSAAVRQFADDVVDDARVRWPRRLSPLGGATPETTASLSLYLFAKLDQSLEPYGNDISLSSVRNGSRLDELSSTSSRLPNKSRKRRRVTQCWSTATR
jgi:hypothetical protein